MEQVTSTIQQLRAPKRPEDIAAGNLLAAQADLVTEDPATFLVAHHILVTGVQSISKIKSYFKRSPEVLEIVDELLCQMERADLISVDGDKLAVKQRFVDIGGDVENLRRFVPRLFKVSADRVLSDANSGLHKQKREALRYFAIPDDSQTSLEAQAIYLEFKTKMLALVDRASKEGRVAEGVRLVGAFNCSLVPEDFA